MWKAFLRRSDRRFKSGRGSSLPKLPSDSHFLKKGGTFGRKKKLTNNTGIPQHRIEAIARCILPDILAFYESEEGQREFAEWKKQRELEKQEVKAE